VQRSELAWLVRKIAFVLQAFQKPSSHEVLVNVHLVSLAAELPTQLANDALDRHLVVRTTTTPADRPLGE
jgi:hypothetical protein